MQPAARAPSAALAESPITTDLAGSLHACRNGAAETGMVPVPPTLKYGLFAGPVTDGSPLLDSAATHPCHGLTMILRHSLAFLLALTFASGSTVARAETAVEFYNKSLDHFFVSSLLPDIEALDSGRIPGWTRTGRGFEVFASQAGGGPGVNPVCRFYIPPQHGNSHFLSASPAECAAILAKIPTDPNYSGYIHESPDAFYIALPNTGTGACPAGTVPVSRLWNQRADSNHRYTGDPGIKVAMQDMGYRAEGYGPNAAVMCSPVTVELDALTQASGASPFVAGCDGVGSTGVVQVGAEVEPYVAVNPTNANNLVGVWQQDRWNNGGARGLGGAYSMDGGGTWTRTSVPFSRCSGGNPGNGGDFERATDPWVSIAPDGTVHQMALAFNNRSNADNAMLASRSTDGGRTWSQPITLRRDGADAFNDKNAITADPTDARYVYAVWDRLSGNDGPTWFARTADGGLSWEPAREIYNPGSNTQTINNLIVVLPDGTLALSFTELETVGAANLRLRIIRSTDKGATWSPPATIATLQGVGTVDPENGTPLRDGAILGAIAAGRNGTLAVVWQDARFSGGAYDGIAFSRSLDGGLNWSAPVRINGAPAVPAFLPAVAIRDDGIIGVAYYDLRSNTPDPNTLLTDIWLATSSDGITWQEKSLARPFDYSTAPRAGLSLFLGDYIAVAAFGNSFAPFFAQTTGDPNNRSDVFAALRRGPAVPTPFAREAVALQAGSAPALPMTPELSARLTATARNAISGRIPEGILPGRSAAP